MRFTITYSGVWAGYKVSVPNFEGGEVVTADEHDRLRDALRGVLPWAETSDDWMGDADFKKRDAAVAAAEAALNEEQR